MHLSTFRGLHRDTEQIGQWVLDIRNRAARTVQPGQVVLPDRSAGTGQPGTGQLGPASLLIGQPG
jgi:hypothetical protein